MPAGFPVRCEKRGAWRPPARKRNRLARMRAEKTDETPGVIHQTRKTAFYFSLLRRYPQKTVFSPKTFCISIVPCCSWQRGSAGLRTRTISSADSAERPLIRTIRTEGTGSFQRSAFGGGIRFFDCFQQIYCPSGRINFSRLSRSHWSKVTARCAVVT